MSDLRATSNSVPLLRRWVNWLWDKSPEWWPEWLDDLLIKSAQWLHCRVHGHLTWVEMDGHSICCTICHKKIGDTRA